MGRLRTLIKWEFDFLVSGGGSLSQRLGYAIRKYACMARNGREIRYQGSTFHFDNRLAPAVFQVYPFELQKLAHIIPVKNDWKILDVGANLGQFAVCFLHAFPDVQITSFEPNPYAYQYLEKNHDAHGKSAQWKIIPQGIGARDELVTFYFVEGKSAQGSVFEDNATTGLQGSAKEIQVQLCSLTTENCTKLKMPMEFDLIKIDVEGAELAVLEGCLDVQCEYLLVEVSMNRTGASSRASVVKLIESTFGRTAQEIWNSGASGQGTSIDLLFKMV